MQFSLNVICLSNSKESAVQIFYAYVILCSWLRYIKIAVAFTGKRKDFGIVYGGLYDSCRKVHEEKKMMVLRRELVRNLEAA